MGSGCCSGDGVSHQAGPSTSPPTDDAGHADEHGDHEHEHKHDHNHAHKHGHNEDPTVDEPCTQEGECCDVESCCDDVSDGSATLGCCDSNAEHCNGKDQLRPLLLDDVNLQSLTISS